MTGEADPGGPCRFLEFDSDLFRIRVASLPRRSIEAEGLDRALAWCAEQRIDCLYFLVEGDDVETLRLARERGFQFVDVRMSFEREIGPPGAAPAAAGTGIVRPARKSDIPALRELAARSHAQSRFFVDERFDRRASAELYATWIEKSCRGYADAVFVVDHEGRAAGYLTCHRREGGLGEIGLVGVAEPAQGRGFGRALVERGLEWFRASDCARASVVTQGTNVPAQRLYQAAGFHTASVQIWHHLWFRPGSGRPS